MVGRKSKAKTIEKRFSLPVGMVEKSSVQNSISFPDTKRIVFNTPGSSSDTVSETPTKRDLNFIVCATNVSLI